MRIRTNGRWTYIVHAFGEAEEIPRVPREGARCAVHDVLAVEFE